MALSSCEFREDGCRESHTLLEHVNETLPYFLPFLLLCKICTEDDYKNVFSD